MEYIIYIKNKGAALLLTLLILTAILSIAFGVSTLMLGETKLSQEVPRSLRAYYAAEAGIERKLYEIRGTVPNYNDIGVGPIWCGAGGIGRVPLGDETYYAVDVIPGGTGTCSSALSYCIKSYGCYKGTRRAIEVSY